MKGVLSWLVRWASGAGTRYFCPALAALVSPGTNNFFSHRTLFQVTAQQAGRQSCRVAYLLLCVSGCKPHICEVQNELLSRT
jgi:hypothetical protein